jgi:hypothetical protein
VKSHMLSIALISEWKHSKWGNLVINCTCAALIDNIASGIYIILGGISWICAPGIIRIPGRRSPCFSTNCLIISPRVGVALSQRIMLNVALPSYTLVFNPVLVAS